MAVSVRFISLNCLAVDQHVVEVACRTCLPFFEKSLLSLPKYAEQHIAVYKELLEAMATSSSHFSRDEAQFMEESIAKLQLLLDKNPDCEHDIFEKAMVSIGLARNRLDQNPGFDHIPYGSDHGKAVSRRSVEEVLSFVKAKEEALKFVLQLPLKDPLPEFVVVDSQSLLSCTGESPPTRAQL